MLRSCIEKILPERPKAAPGEEPPVMACPALATQTTADGDEWVVVDTETSGLFAPIYAVEIAAQRMRGWSPVGKPFRILLNHDVELEPAAVATHGYTREYLRRHGTNPSAAHDAFAAYAGNLPMVAHNLAYDFNRVLEPEWARLHRQNICPAGFCTVMMSRRCLPEITSASLESLGTQFRLGTPSHQAGQDVAITVRLLCEVLNPRLDKAGIRTFAQAQEFSRRTPLAACRKILAGEIPPAPAPRKPRRGLKARKFLQFVSLLTQDGQITQLEFEALCRWLENEGCQSSEAAKVADLVEKITADGIVTPEELSLLQTELQRLAGG
jgi:DNA polymerase III epsilon subunit-like protein